MSDMEVIVRLFSYYNGTWRYNTNGTDIQRDLNERFNCIENIRIERTLPCALPSASHVPPRFIYSSRVACQQ
jgi:hypothetical protein